MIQTSRAPKVTQNEVATTEISTAWEKLNWKRKDDDDFDSRPLLPAFFIPREKSVSLTAHERSVTAMAINPKGSRLATGGHDAEVIISCPTFCVKFSIVVGQALGLQRDEF